ncbi:MAG: hypothetical protein WAU53_03100 [Rhodoplanes sp.]
MAPFYGLQNSLRNRGLPQLGASARLDIPSHWLAEVLSRPVFQAQGDSEKT